MIGRAISRSLAGPALLHVAHYIAGRWVCAKSGMTFAVTDPGNGNHLCDVADCVGDPATAAIDAAELALPDLRARPAKERSDILHRFCTDVCDRAEPHLQIHHDRTGVRART